MRRMKLVNVTFIDPNQRFRTFRVAGYSFHPQLPEDRPKRSMYTSEMAVRDNRRIAQNAYAEFSHRQSESIMFCGGQYGDPQVPRKRKLIEDILVLGSILTSHNWALFSRRHYPQYPVVAANHLRLVSRDETQIESDLSRLLTALQDHDWQARHSRGFQFIKLLNTSNILVAEARFLSNVVIWELLYTQLYRESHNLHEIMRGLLEHFWPQRVNHAVFRANRVNRLSSNICYVLRNQLAHNGRLPIDREYAEPWMREIPVEHTYGSLIQSLGDYMTFFNTLTQVMVLKTAGLDIEQRLGTWNFEQRLNRFLSTGRI